MNAPPSGQTVAPVPKPFGRRLPLAAGLGPLLLAVNVLAAIGFVVAGSLAVALHRADSRNLYQEFLSVGAVNETQLKTLASTREGTGPDYDMRARLRQMGQAESWFNSISGWAATVCLANAAMLFMMHRQTQTGTGRSDRLQSRFGISAGAGQRGRPGREGPGV